MNGAHTATFTYDDDGLLTGAGALAVARDPDTGLVTGTTLGNVETEMTNSGFGELETSTASFSGSPLYAASYTRDKLGRITTKVETVEGVTTSWSYGYDLAGRLETVLRDGQPFGSYTYDANGNRTSYDGFWGAATGTYDDQDRMTSYGGAIYTYTPNGELLTKTEGADVTTYDYDVFGNLRGVVLPDGTEIEYVIDAQNRRIGKKVEGVLVQAFLYKNQLEPLAELDDAGNVVSRFVYGARAHVPDYIVRASGTYSVVVDQLGSVRLVVDSATGVVAQQIEYDEFGAIRSDTNPGFQPFALAGGLWDPHARFVRFGWRDYDPYGGRWTAMDPVGFGGRSSNQYGYVDNDPVSLVDWWGLSACTGLVDDLLDYANRTAYSQLGRHLLIRAQKLARIPKSQLAFDGFRGDLVADGQNSDVHRHIYGHAGAELDWFGGGMLGWLAERADRKQLEKDPSRGETRAELAGNQAGREAGAILRELFDGATYVPHDKNLAPFRDAQTDLLCEPECD